LRSGACADATCQSAQPSAGSGVSAGAKGEPRSQDPGAAGRLRRDAARRAIKFYLPYSRSLYFIDKGRERGISADVIREFERWVNRKYAKQLGKRP